MSNNAIIATYAVIVVLAVILAIVFFAYQPALAPQGEVAGTSTEAGMILGTSTMMEEKSTGTAATSTATSTE